MPFFNKPSAGPDSVGGVWPWEQIAKVRNRSGSTISRGDLCQLAFGAGNTAATEIATNDSNSYVPGASNDTIWNTVIDPISNTLTSTNGIAGNRMGGIFGIALEDFIDNAAGNVQFFGVIENAFVVDSGTSKDGAQPSQLLAVNVTNVCLDCHIGTNKVIVGFYIDSNDATLTSRTLKRVFLTQGLGCAINGKQVGGQVIS